MAVNQIGIAFHGIGLNAREMEPGEDRYWISRDTFLQQLDLIAALPDPTRVILTFDDGNASDHDIALPALQERGLTGSFFILTGRIDGQGSLSAPQLGALAAAGMTVGSHGMDHVDWRRIGPDQLQRELTQSKGTLETAVGRTIATASIPFGRYDKRVLSALRDAGYRTVFTSDGGVTPPGSFLVGRTNIRADTTMAQFVHLVTARESSTARFIRGLKALRRRFT